MSTDLPAAMSDAIAPPGYFRRRARRTFKRVAVIGLFVGMAIAMAMLVILPLRGAL